MKQIIGGNLDKAMKDFYIQAEKVHETEPDWAGVSLQVWELPERELEALNEIESKDWTSEHGWYRYGGCNYNKNDNILSVIKGKTITVFKESVNYFDELEDFAVISEEFQNLEHYFLEYIGISKYENYAYFIHSLAEMNDISKSELLKNYW